jgi:hypothetical protein
MWGLLGTVSKYLTIGDWRMAIGYWTPVAFLQGNRKSPFTNRQ